jgi:hypothetical protein
MVSRILYTWNSLTNVIFMSMLYARWNIKEIQPLETLDEVTGQFYSLVTYLTGFIHYCCFKNHELYSV